MKQRVEVLDELAGMIGKIRLSHPVRVGIDGVDCSGKTSLAGELASLIEGLKGDVIRVSIDGFHNPKEIRYRQGRKSPRGFYEDTFDLQAILKCVLLPLGPGGDCRYNPSQFDYRTDSPQVGSWQQAAQDSVLLFDGIFLHRPELRPHWDFTIFVHVEFDETVRRARERDQYLFGDPDEVEAIYRERYIPGQRIYLETEKPVDKADVVVDNNDIMHPVLKVRRTRY